MRKRPTLPETRNEARLLAVQTANEFSLRRHLSRPPTRTIAGLWPRVLNNRQWQQAVFTCRQFRLLDESTLRLATTGRLPEATSEKVAA